jgi:hypothetical protein
MTPLFIMFYKLRALGPAWQLLPIAALGTWALVVNGTFFAAMSLRTSQPRDHVAAAFVSDLDSRVIGHGECNHSHF